MRHDLESGLYVKAYAICLEVGCKLVARRDGDKPIYDVVDAAGRIVHREINLQAFVELNGVGTIKPKQSDQ